MLKILQANLQHAKASSAVACKVLQEDGLDMALLQEPWIHGNTVLGLTAAGFCTDDLVAAHVMLPGCEGMKLIVSSAYLPGEHTDPSTALAPLVEYCEDQNAQLVIGADCNSHHTAWGSTDTNKRGEILFDFLLTNNLLTLNDGNTPTFVTRARQEVLDVTICTGLLERRACNWHVSKEASMSDHRHIRFDIALIGKSQVETFRNPKATDWDVYRHQVSENLGVMRGSVKSTQQLESTVEELGRCMLDAYENSCPLKTRCSNTKVPWWNSNLEHLRKTARKEFNRAKITKQWDLYRKALTEFNRELRKAKRQSWRRFCEEVKSAPHVAKIKKILSKSPSANLGLLKRPDGTFTESPEETLRLLAQTHFPGSLDGHSDAHAGQQPTKIRPSNEDWRKASQVFTPNRVRWAIKSFMPFKTGGEDNIFPALLQEACDIILPIVVKIFRASYAWGYMPHLWTRVRVTFIPKTGNRDKSLPKSYRPISLTSFMLKAMEKVINLHIRTGYLTQNPLHVKQHAYQKGKSTETALIELTDRIEKALEDKEIALCAFLDVEGAFDNTSTNVILKCMRDKNIDNTTLTWVESMLTNRTVKTTLLDKSIEVKITRGCPQGGVLSPLEWSIVVDTLLCELNEARFDTQGYADDLVITIVGKSASTISDLMQRALRMVERWCREYELSVNASKTIIVPFTRRRILDGLRPPDFFGETVNFSKEAKYLGVILDQKLTWNQHLQYIAQKAKCAMGSCCRLVGKKWGLKPKLTLWLYEAVVRPMVTYGCVVWHRKTQQKTCQDVLSSLQRLACLMATGAIRSTPTAAMEAMLNLSPLHIHVQKEARSAMLRAAEGGRNRWHSAVFSSLHRELLSTHAMAMPSDAMETEYCFSRLFSVEIPEREKWNDDKALQTFRSGDIVWYTDGSKKEGLAGSGIYGERPRARKYASLGRFASVFQAEIYAIIGCAYENLDRAFTRRNIFILSDSQAALKALTSAEVNSKLIMECILILNKIGANNRVTLRWVPGHCGINGNEEADELARLGAESLPLGPEPIIGLPKCTSRREIKDWAHNQSLEAWNNVPGQHHARALIVGYSQKFTRRVLELTRNQIRVLTRTLSGHCRLNRHLHKMGLSDTPICRFCNEEDETPMHILCECEAIIHKRNRILGGYKLAPIDVRSLPPGKIIRFIKDLGLESEI
ncbi:uncharacterized protein LOC105391530 [Plutella xylostella]|uniref:uncharacterized protein LOC105391530 n=1 Tax=Plutella xylostella TaxID=51655 RepID=UPI0020323FDC|nr:uncharacterized protein LOC105391530 [Plutella xylostella]